jgi:hypothetical protein
MPKGYLISWHSSTSFLSLLPFWKPDPCGGHALFPEECFRVIYLTHYTG